MYNIDISGTGQMTLNNFSSDQQKQILYVLDKIASTYDEKKPDSSKVRYLGDGFYVIRINHVIRAMANIQNNTFNIIDVFNHARSANLV